MALAGCFFFFCPCLVYKYKVDIGTVSLDIPEEILLSHFFCGVASFQEEKASDT